MKKQLLLALVSLGLFASCHNLVSYDPEATTPDQTITYETDVFTLQPDNSFRFFTTDPKYRGTTGSSIWHLSKTPTVIPTSYSIELKKTSGKAAGGYGVIFAAPDAPLGGGVDTGLSNFLCVFITNEGKYQVGKVADKTYSMITGWVKGEWRIPAVDGNGLATGTGVSNTIHIVYDSSTPLTPFCLYFNDAINPELRFYDSAYVWTGRIGFITTILATEDLPNHGVETFFSLLDPTSGIEFPQ